MPCRPASTRRTARTNAESRCSGLIANCCRWWRLAEDPLDVLDAAMDDAAAEACWPRRRWARLDHLGDQPLVRLFIKDDEAAVGLLEELEQVIADFRQQRFQLEGPAEAVGDFEHRAQLLGRLRLEDLLAAGVAEGRFVGRRRAGGIDPVVRVLVAKGGRQRLQDWRLVEAAHEVADLDLVVVLELHPVLHRLIVDIGAVAALHVLDEELALLANDVRVGPADGGAVDDDMAVRVSPQNELVALEGHHLPRGSSFLHLQRSHTFLVSREAGTQAGEWTEHSCSILSNGWRGCKKRGGGKIGKKPGNTRALLIHRFARTDADVVPKQNVQAVREERRRVTSREAINQNGGREKIPVFLVTIGLPSCLIT